MNSQYKYIGIFFENLFSDPRVKQLGGGKLYRRIEDHHVTFAYRPKEADESLFGEKVRVRVIGYGCDGENEGLKVVVLSEHSKLQHMADEIAVPHITLSVGEGGESVNTYRIPFEPVEPFELEGIFGGYTLSGEKVLDHN